MNTKLAHKGRAVQICWTATAIVQENETSFFFVIRQVLCNAKIKCNDHFVMKMNLRSENTTIISTLREILPKGKLLTIKILQFYVFPIPDNM